MSFTSTSRRWSVARGAFVAGAVAATTLVAMATPASAHTPTIKAGCKDGTTTLKVELLQYNKAEPNTVKVTNGDEVLVDTTFETEYVEEWEFDGTADYVFTVTVEAWDDESGDKGWSFEATREVEACAEPEPEPTTTTVEPAPTTTTEEVAPSTTVAPPTTTEVASDTDLANTGAGGIGIPLALGSLLLIGGGLLVMIARRRARA